LPDPEWQGLEAGAPERSAGPSPSNEVCNPQHVVSLPVLVQDVVYGAASGTASGPLLAPAAVFIATGGRLQSENRRHAANPEPQVTPRALAMGALVRVHSLQSALEPNGVLGEIVKHDVANGRWDVKTATGNVMSLKPSNLTLVSKADVAAEEVAGSQGRKNKQVCWSKQQVMMDLAKAAHWKKGSLKKTFEIYCNTLNGHLEVAKLVNGARGRELLIATESCGTSMLHFAAGNGHVEIFKVLLVAGGSELPVTNEAGNSCLHAAVYTRNLKVLKEMLALGDGRLLMLTDKGGMSCLFAAAHTNQLEIVKVLVDAGGRDLLLLTRNDNISCLNIAAIMNNF